MKIIVGFLTSEGFANFTHRAGAYLLLVSNILLPAGLHRPWMGIGGWWLFPTAFALAGFGTLNYMSSHVTAWQMLSLPYVALFIFDSRLLALAPVPPSDR
jgi:hypothetical protein